MFKKLFEISRSEDNRLGVFHRHAKMGEEFGEFAEGLLVREGVLIHKTLTEPLIGEGADLIITIVDTLAATYPALSPDELDALLMKTLDFKSEKWIKTMKNHAEKCGSSFKK